MIKNGVKSPLWPVFELVQLQYYYGVVLAPEFIPVSCLRKLHVQTCMMRVSLYGSLY